MSSILYLRPAGIVLRITVFRRPRCRSNVHPAFSNMALVPLCRNEDEVFLPGTSSLVKETTSPPARQRDQFEGSVQRLPRHS
jgi:hypothetical protein